MHQCFASFFNNVKIFYTVLSNFFTLILRGRKKSIAVLQCLCIDDVLIEGGLEFGFLDKEAVEHVDDAVGIGRVSLAVCDHDDGDAVVVEF